MAQTSVVRLLPDGCVEWHSDKTPRQGDLSLLAGQTAGKRFILAYPGERVHCLSLQAPARRRTAWLKALPYALEDQVAQDITTLHIATGPVAAGGATPVMLTDQDALADTLAALQEYGIDPLAAVPDFLLLPLQPGHWTVWQDGERMLVRLGEYAGFVCERDNLALCLRKALAECPAAPDCVRVIGASGYLDEFNDLRLQEEPGQPFSSLAATEPATVNLRTGKFARHKAAPRWWPQWRAAAILAGVSIILALLQNAWQWRQLEAEKNRLQAAIEQTFRQVLPTARLVNPRAQMEAHLRQLGQSDTSEDSAFLPLLGIAARALQEHSTLKLRGLSFRQGMLELDLTGGSLEQLDTLKAKLAQNSALFVDIKASVRENQVLSRLGLQFQRAGDS